MPLLTALDYPAIRAAIDTKLGPALLPDAVIGLDLYIGAAQREVLRRIPDAEDRTGNALAVCRTAAILFCAGLLVPAVPQIQGESHGDDTYSRKLADPTALAAELVRRAEAELNALVDPTAPSTGPALRPMSFRTARGGRGR